MDKYRLETSVNYITESIYADGPIFSFMPSARDRDNVFLLALGCLLVLLVLVCQAISITENGSTEFDTRHSLA